MHQSWEEAHFGRDVKCSAGATWPKQVPGLRGGLGQIENSLDHVNLNENIFRFNETRQDSHGTNSWRPLRALLTSGDL